MGRPGAKRIKGTLKGKLGVNALFVGVEHGVELGFGQPPWLEQIVVVAVLNTNVGGVELVEERDEGFSRGHERVVKVQANVERARGMGEMGGGGRSDIFDCLRAHDEEVRDRSGGIGTVGAMRTALGACRLGGERVPPHVREIRGGEPVVELFLWKAHPAVIKFFTEEIDVVRLEVDDEEDAAVLEDTSGLAEHDLRIGGVRKDEGKQRDVDRGIFNRKRFSGALPNIDVGEIEFANTRAGTFEHGRRGIDGDYFFDVRGEKREHRTSTRPDVGDGPGGVEQCEERFQMEGIAEPLCAKLVPLRRMLAEERIVPVGGVALAEGGGQAMGVGFCNGIVIEVRAGEGAELFACVVRGGFGEFVEHARAFAAGVGEVGVGERFEMAGHRGLREFEDIAKLADRQAPGGGVLGLCFKEPHDAQTDGIGKGAEQLDEVPRAAVWRRIARSG